MSNLFKQYNTIESQDHVRVIDCNAKVEEKLATLVRKHNSNEESFADGFQGLGTIAEEVVKEDSAEVLLNAKTEAEEILQRAREEAEKILSSANEEAEEILNTAKEDGYKEGYESGLKEAKAVSEAEYAQKNAELEQYRLKLQEDYHREMKELEPQLLDVILTVVEKVFHIQFDDKKDILLYLVSNTIEHIEGCKNFRIRISEEQKTFLENHKEEILEHIGHDMSLEFLSDVSLEDNQCVIETDTGVFDCSLGVQLENLIKNLKSLSS